MDFAYLCTHKRKNDKPMTRLRQATKDDALFIAKGFQPAGSLFIFGHTYWKMEIASSSPQYAHSSAKP